MEYNIKMAKYKNSTNLVHPYFLQLRHRQVRQVACGDYHTLFLVGGALNAAERSYEVMGLGENTVGQILGKPTKGIIKEPVVISELSGKNIKGITACRESSLAWDEKGNIYEWGIKDKRDEVINVTYSLNDKIVQLEKGYQHYAALTASGKCKVEMI
jgi:alpha-tubulin suppressor-like RCC1 family protein